MRSLRASLSLLVCIVVVGGCESTSGQDDPQSPGTPGGVTSDVRVDVVPRNGAVVAPADGIQVRAQNGRIDSVAVTTASGTQIRGEFTADRTAWSADQALAFATRYTVVATGVDNNGAKKTTTSAFKTATAKKRVHTAILPLDGETVGVGLPIQVRFTAPVADRAAAERSLVVASAPKVVGAWHWVSDRTVRYRPRTYWPAGTKATLRVRLQGVELGDGVYGDEQRDVSFTIGRSMVTVVDGRRLRMTVYRDGKAIRTVPVTMGKKGWETRNGVKVILEKHALKVMDGATLGIPKNSPEYYRLDVRWALRMTWSGEFVHGAPWSVAAQGATRVSHGCVGMSLDNARWYFGQSIRGDVIKIAGSPTRRTMELDNGFGDWNLPWNAWLSGSATGPR